MDTLTLVRQSPEVRSAQEIREQRRAAQIRIHESQPRRAHQCLSAKESWGEVFHRALQTILLSIVLCTMKDLTLFLVESLNTMTQCVQISRPVGVIIINGFAPITPRHHVIERTRVFQPKGASHMSPDINSGGSSGYRPALHNERLDPIPVPRYHTSLIGAFLRKIKK